MNDNRLGKNIKALRKAYGETQEELGNVIGVEKNTVSYYENGKREPDKDIINKIAHYYSLPAEMLMFCDLSEISKIEIDNTLFWKKIRKLLPIIDTKNASNPHLKKALESHNQLFDNLENLKLGEREYELINLCLQEYLLAYEDENVKLVAGANYLALWYLWIFILKIIPQIVESQPAALLQIFKKNPETERLFDNKIDKKSIDLIKGLIEKENDTQKLELTEEIRKMLKKSGQYSDFADYFIALEYIWNLVDNDLGFELNQRIGFEMLCAFLRADNEYAFSYFIYGIVATGQSSQFVDDDLRELL